MPEPLIFLTDPQWWFAGAGWKTLALLLGGNLFLAILSAGVTGLLCRISGRPWSTSEMGFLLVLGGGVPVLGPLLLVPAVVVFSYLGAGAPNPIPELFDIPEYAPRQPLKITRFSAGGVVKRLLGEGGAERSAEEALLVLDHHNHPSDTQVLRQALNHRSDYLRMLSFSMLERREKHVLELMHLINEHLNQNSDPVLLARLHKEKAFLHWELIYQALSQEDLHRFHRDEASFHVQLALELRPHDVALKILQARLALQFDAHGPALEAFKEAERLHGSPSRIAPFLAELAFREGRLDQVRGYLCKSPSLKYLLRLKSIYAFWESPYESRTG